MKEKLIRTFQKKFNTTKIPLVFFAPGRVNLIGEHIDYNGGFVLPFAIQLGTYATVALRNDNLINFVSENFDDSFSVKINEIDFKTEHKWANYPKGVIKIFSDAGFKINKGFDVIFSGNLPTEAGLSSSASIEVLTAVMLNEIFNFKIPKIEIVKLCQKAENEYIGVECGIMDQFAVAMGKKNHAILLNTQTLDYEYVPLNFGDEFYFYVVNSMKKRELVDSEFNKRKKECKIALKFLQKELKISELCQINSETFLKHQHLIKDEIIRKRAKHVITENERTLKFANIIKKQESINYLGQLLVFSHFSLHNDYEVTGYELDSLVRIILESKGVIGARMMGAGFGGCAISLVRKEFVTDFISNVAKYYYEKTNLKPEFYSLSIEDGAREI